MFESCRQVLDDESPDFLKGCVSLRDAQNGRRTTMTVPDVNQKCTAKPSPAIPGKSTHRTCNAEVRESCGFSFSRRSLRTLPAGRNAGIGSHFISQHALGDNLFLHLGRLAPWF